MRFGSSAFFKNIIFTTFILVASASNRQGALMAQGFMGFHSDNYSGVHSLQWNPVLLVDNRLAFQMNLSSSHFTVTNNYIGINAPSFLLNPTYLYFCSAFIRLYLNLLKFCLIFRIILAIPY